MDMFGRWRGDTISITSKEDEKRLISYMTKVYGWMFLGLTITAVVAFLMAGSPQVMTYLMTHRMLFLGLFLGELLLVGYLVVRVHKLSAATATLLFLAYAAVNGVVFSLLLLAYTGSSIASTFAITAGTFGVMSAVGYFTKQDLTSFGKLMFMGLIGIIIASLVNIFLQSSALYWIISYVGVAVFVGLIAYDTQKIKAYALIEDQEMRKKGAIMGALALYLDFVNLFIMLLRLFGSRN
ncbi:MAG TPA: Bax inhibitor-1/YccA family protein [Edaphocola sp.]|nr:Bax inhibitor-1/YccA family protein [Edaphocola sp.]